MTAEIGPGVRRFREARARGEAPDAGAIAREHPEEALAIADEALRDEALYWERAREEMRLARAEVMREAGEDVTFGTVFRNAREDRGIAVSALAAAARERGADLAPTTIERLEANQIAVTDVDPEVWAALIDDLQIGRHEFVASVWMALLEAQTHHSLTSTGRRASTLDPDAADYLDRVRSALGLPTAAPRGDVTVTPGPARAETPAVSAPRDLEDITDVQAHIDRIFEAQPAGRGEAIRRMFVEVLDFNQDSGQVPLSGAPEGVELPGAAERVAELDGVHVVYVALDSAATNRVRRAEVSEAARLIAGDLGDDLLLVFTDRDVSQLQLVLPELTGSRPTLRRMVVERYLPQRTAVEQIARIYRGPGDTRSVPAALAEAFDVEPVTKRFFAEYKRVFEQVEQTVTGFATSEDDERRLFVQTLFNRLMFVYFLQRKGWLEFRGVKDYLEALWDDYRQNRRETENFHDSRLRNLFFAGLNNPESRDVTDGMEPLIGKVPFLNGGLFEQGDLDERGGVTVPDEAIEAILTEIFDHFNFTVMESTPFDIEVAVDPEMLGKVFEELVTGRHDSGAYYTPRPVVSFMCREALKGYLEGATSLGAEPIRLLVDEHDASGISLAQAQAVAGALDEVTVVDPACGSGAYLLGMMQELVELWAILYSDRLKTDARSLYDLKLHIIERNLYGVDIDAFAVNTTMLRMWLSLAIDFDGDRLAPLPNLDFKVVCGDSLLGPDPGVGSEVQISLGQDRDAMLRLGELKAAYMLATATKDKERLRLEIADLEDSVRRALGFGGVATGVVDWRVEFADVFVDRGGFDIAVANPPYVRHEKIGSHLHTSDPPGRRDQSAARTYKQALTKQFSAAASARSDLYCYFYSRSLQILNRTGMQVFVCSNSWLDTTFGARLQEYLLRNARIGAVYESAVERQFSTADVNTIISILRNNPGSDDHETRFVSLRGEFESALANAAERHEVTRTRSLLLSEGSRAAKYVGDKWGGKFLRAPDIYHRLSERWSDRGRIPTLGDYVDGERYLNTGGADGFFVLTDVSHGGQGTSEVTIRSREGRAAGFPHFQIETQFLQPGYRRTDSPRLEIREPDCHVLSIPPDTDVANYQVQAYIAWGNEVGFSSRSVTRTQSPWWRPPLQAQRGALLLWPRTHAESHRCYYNSDRIVSLRFFRLHPKRAEHVLPVLAVLNSTVYALLKEVHGRRGLGQGALETGLVDILPLPFPQLTTSVASQLSEAVQPLLRRDIGSVANEVLEADRNDLDRLVMQQMGLPSDAISELYGSVLEMIALRKTKAANVGG